MPLAAVRRQEAGREEPLRQHQDSAVSQNYDKIGQKGQGSTVMERTRPLRIVEAGGRVRSSRLVRSRSLFKPSPIPKLLFSPWPAYTSSGRCCAVTAATPRQ